MKKTEVLALLKANQDDRGIRHWKKLKAIRSNAHYLVDLAGEHGTAAMYVSHVPAADHIGLRANPVFPVPGAGE